MMRLRTSHSVGALLLLLAARGAPSAGSRSPASGTLARPRLEGSASGRPREPQAEFGRRQATSGAQLLKLVASDGVADDYFGVVVAVSSDGARVVVGAHADDAYSGSVHVFDGTSGERLLKLVASDGAGWDYFGWAVAVSSDGARVVVGAYYDDDQGDNSGSVHVFDGTTGERLLKLVASDGAADDNFGFAVAVSSDGARVVVGPVMTTTILAPCTCSDGAADDYFGIAVAVSSDGARVVVGASDDDDQGDNSGSVHVFDGTSGERLLKLVASDGAADDYFGIAVAVSSDGARVVVGASDDDDQGDNSGSVYVFDGTIVTTRTATSSAASSTITTIKTTTETTTETTTVTTTKTATTTIDTGTSSATSNTTATTEPWEVIAVLILAGIWILCLGCAVALGCLVRRGPWQGPNTLARHSQSQAPL
ncbi:unnamed protein product [Prorocentrum cordatum]|uniref:Uncharacterized protein n=1 Tax=Prorocentrum cordatum TaxID=2364126 RepID=A0ABN9VE26_9DINO|nr:unnamed protein product [Polarella glacialis]